MQHFILLSILMVLTVTSSYGQADGVRLTVHAGAYGRQDTPVCIALDDPDIAGRELRETTPGHSGVVAAQYTDGQLCWILSGASPAGSTRTFLLSPSVKSGDGTASVTATDRDGSVHFALGEQEVMTYQYARAEVPEGVDPIYSRGGFIHPLLSPAGGRITRIQPPDHYHHYGVWNPWTHTEYRGRELDFWNLVRGQGTVDARGIRNVHGGTVYAGLTADLTYLVFRDSAVTTDPEEVLDETLDLRVYAKAQQQEGYLVDFSSTQHNPTEYPFTVTAYRYQGFGLRATERWDDANVHLLTSAGYDKSDGNATRARWMDVRGPTEAGEAGVLLMAHPDNYNSPEQIRIWPTGSNEGRENVFLNFNPAQDRDYRLRAGGTYNLRYRMYVYDGQIDTAAANRYWQDFAYPPRVVRDGASPLDGKHVLVYTRNGEGYVHENIPASIAALKKMGEENGFRVTASDDPGVFTEGGLAPFDLLVFSNTNNDIFTTPAQEAVFKTYIRNGGAFVGIHSACGSERDSPWFARILGGRFFRHPPQQDFDVAVLDADHPSTSFLPPTWHIRNDECYYLKELNPDIHVLLAADLSTVEDGEGEASYPADTFGELFPTAWHHTADGGRQWYTSLGHRIEHYSDPLFLRHLQGGMEWAVRPHPGPGRAGTN